MAGWSVNRQINLGDMLAMAGMCATILSCAFGGYLYLSGRIDDNDKVDIVQTVQIENMEKRYADGQASIEKALAALSTDIRDLRKDINEKQDK